MDTLDDLRSRHAELRKIIAELQPLLSQEVLAIRPNATTAFQCICALSEKVITHLTAEDKGLYPSLLTHQDPKVKSLAWGFISGERPLRRLFCDYRQRWIKECDFSFTDPFLGETAQILSMVLDRIEREERVLFPKLEEIGVYGRSAAKALHRNP